MLDHAVAYVALLALLGEPIGSPRGAALPTAAAHNPGPLPAGVCQVLPRPVMRLRLSIFDEGDRLNADAISQHAAQIWHAEGLSFEWLPLDNPPSWTNLDAWVQVRRGPVVGAESSIGAVRFKGDVPSKLIQVSIANTTRRVVTNLSARLRIDPQAFFSLAGGRQPPGRRTRAGICRGPRTGSLPAGHQESLGRRVDAPVVRSGRRPGAAIAGHAPSTRRTAPGCVNGSTWRANARPPLPSARTRHRRPRDDRPGGALAPGQLPGVSTPGTAAGSRPTAAA